MASKRPHKTLTLAEKHEILQQLRSGVSGRALAVKYGIGTSTISDIKRKSEEITSFVENCLSTPGDKKSMRKGEWPIMEGELYSWFLEQRENHETVTTNVLIEKAKEFHAKHYGDNKFNASKSWVSRFKKRHGICNLEAIGENPFNDPNVVGTFLQKLSETAKEMGLQPNQIYNAGESAMFWKSLPDRTCLRARRKTTTKASNERISFLSCANGDGSHKLKMMVVGKSKNTDECNIRAVPVEYHNSKNSWMTAALFIKWFRESFVKQVKTFQETHNLNGKAILLIDPRHVTDTQLISDDGNIVTMFLPQNCTSLIQPMDQNAIRLKIYYRKSLLDHVSSFGQSDISNTLKQMNLKDALLLLAHSWDKVTPTAISKCWQEIFSYADNDESDSYEVSTDMAPSSLLKEKGEPIKMEIAEINVMLQKFGTENNQLTESEICEWIVGDEDHLPLHSEESDSDIVLDSEKEVVKTEPKVEHEEAIRCFSTCIQWAEENGAELNTVTVLRMLKQSAMQAKYGSDQDWTEFENVRDCF